MAANKDKIKAFLDSTEVVASLNVQQAISNVAEVFEDMTNDEKKMVLLVLLKNYKSLPIGNDETFNQIKKDNIDKSKAYSKKVSDRMIKEYKEGAELIDRLFEGVDKDYINWSILCRGMEAYLGPLSKVYLEYGNIALKSVGNKGFFMFFLKREEAKRWIDAQMYITFAILERLKTAIKREDKTSRIKPPKKYEDWLELIDKKKCPKLVQPSLEEWRSKVKAHFAAPAPLTLSNDNITYYLQAWLLLYPGRALLDRDQVIAGRVIDVDRVSALVAKYIKAFSYIASVFDVEAIEGVAMNKADLNNKLASRIQVMKNLIAAYRQKCYGDKAAPLAKGEAREFTEKFDIAVAIGNMKNL